MRVLKAKIGCVSVKKGRENASTTKMDRICNNCGSIEPELGSIEVDRGSIEADFGSIEVTWARSKLTGVGSIEVDFGLDRSLFWIEAELGSIELNL